MNLNALIRIINRITLDGLLSGANFRLLEKGDGFLLQLTFLAKDTETGNEEMQMCRKWYVSAFSTETEVVGTAFKACRSAIEHELREGFLYLGQRIYSPHIRIDDRLATCRNRVFDQRETP